MREVVVVLFLGVVAGAFATRSDSGQSAPERLVLRDEFARRVDAYVALHRQLEQLLPPEIVTRDLDALFAPRRAMNQKCEWHGGKRVREISSRLRSRTTFERSLPKRCAANGSSISWNYRGPEHCPRASEGERRLSGGPFGTGHAALSAGSAAAITKGSALQLCWYRLDSVGFSRRPDR